MLPHGSAISAGPLLDFYLNCNTGILLFFHLVLVLVFYLLDDPAAGACRAFPFGQGQLGAQPGADSLKVPSAGPGVTSGSVSPHVWQSLKWQQH